MGLLLRWAILLMAAASLQARAAEPVYDYYGGVMLGVLDYSQDGVGYNMSSINGRLGYQMSRSFAVEARAVTSGPGDASGTIYPGSTYQVDALGSLLAKFDWQPIKDSEAYFHLLLGGTAMRTSMNVPGAPLKKNSLFGFSYGLGLDLFADRTRAINFEWIQYQRGGVTGQPGNIHRLSQFGVGYLQRF